MSLEGNRLHITRKKGGDAVPVKRGEMNNGSFAQAMKVISQKERLYLDLFVLKTSFAKDESFRNWQSLV